VAVAAGGSRRPAGGLIFGNRQVQGALTGAPHYAYRSIMDIFADALASKVVTAVATFCQRDTAIKHFTNRFRLEKLYPTTLTKHMNGHSYHVVLHDAEVMAQSC
jgi:hypothetical protein